MRCLFDRARVRVIRKQETAGSVGRSGRRTLQVAALREYGIGRGRDKEEPGTLSRNLCESVPRATGVEGKRGRQGLRGSQHCLEGRKRGQRLERERQLPPFRACEARLMLHSTNSTTSTKSKLLCAKRIGPYNGEYQEKDSHASAHRSPSLAWCADCDCLRNKGTGRPTERTDCNRQRQRAGESRGRNARWPKPGCRS